MPRLRVCKSFHFETAHALYGYDGKCKNIHGHSYQLEVEVFGIISEQINDPKLGMVVDFGEIKSLVNKIIIDPFDHSILLNKNSNHKKLGDFLIEENHNVHLVDYQPTCENILLDIVEKLKTNLKDSLTLTRVKLYETTTSFAEWRIEDENL